ncbi:uncharacterized protein LOC144482353 [Mustelus asterias]
MKMIENSSFLSTRLLRPSPSSIISFPRISGADSGWVLFGSWKSEMKAEKQAQQIVQHLFRERNRVSVSAPEAWKMEVPDWSEVGGEEEPSFNNLLTNIKRQLLWSKAILEQATQSSQDPGTSPLLENREDVRQGRMLEWSKMGLNHWWRLLLQF